MEAIIVERELEISTDGYERYTDFITGLRDTLANHMGEVRDVGGRPVLPRQRHGNQPQRWIYITLRVPNGREAATTTLAIRDDNLYLIGFQNGEGEWYEFGFSGQSKRMLPVPESTFLECDVTYRDMVRDPLTTLKLGLRDALGAVRHLSGHPYTTTDDGSEVRRGLAKLILMICEAARMDPFYQRVISDNGQGIDDQEVKYLRNWGDISVALLRWDNEERWRVESLRISPTRVWNVGPFPWPVHLANIGIRNPDQALYIVRLILHRSIYREPSWSARWRQIIAADRYRRGHGRSGGGPSRGTQPQGPQLPATSIANPPGGGGHGRSHHSEQQQEEDTPPVEEEPDYYEWHARPLVEVFGVRAEGSLPLVGNIAVFDGMRGQIIYDNDDNGAAAAAATQQQQGGGVELVVTGPYTAIPAYGGFTIELDVPDDSDPDGESRLIKDLDWDPYGENSRYDEVASETITAGGKAVEVTYAVLRAAVEAKVEVRLRLPAATPGTPRVYGRIAARSEPMFAEQDGAWSVLFDLGAAAAVPDDDGSGDITLPLARSVVALPVGSWLAIKATLYDLASPIAGAGSDLIFDSLAAGDEGDIKLTPSLAAVKEERRTTNGGVLELTITSPDVVE